MNIDELMEKTENGIYSKDDLLKMHKEAGKKMFTCNTEEVSECEDNFYALNGVIFALGFCSFDELEEIERKLEEKYGGY